MGFILSLKTNRRRRKAEEKLPAGLGPTNLCASAGSLCRMEIVILIGVVALWLLFQLVIGPRLGVPT